MSSPKKPDKDFWKSVSPEVKLCYCGNLTEFFSKINKENLNSQYGADGWTLLHIAVMRGGPEGASIAYKLVHMGANPEIRTHSGWTPWDFCTFYEQEKLFSKAFNFEFNVKKRGDGDPKLKNKGEAPSKARGRQKEKGLSNLKAISEEKLSGAGKFGVEDEKKEFKLSAVFSAENSGIIKALKAKKDEMTEEDKKNVAHLEAMNPVSQAWILAKSIAGLANARGGKIYVGVSDSGRLVGLEKDFEAENLASAPENKRWDKFEMKVRTRIEGMFHNKTVAGALFRMVPVKTQGGRIFCVVEVDEAKAPIYVCKEPETRRWRTAKKDKFEEFYLRRGVATKIVPAEELADYLKQRFPESMIDSRFQNSEFYS